MDRIEADAFVTEYLSKKCSATNCPLIVLGLDTGSMTKYWHCRSLLIMLILIICWAEESLSLGLSSRFKRYWELKNKVDTAE